MKYAKKTRALFLIQLRFLLISGWFIYSLFMRLSFEPIITIWRFPKQISHFNLQLTLTITFTHETTPHFTSIYSCPKTEETLIEKALTGGGVFALPCQCCPSQMSCKCNREMTFGYLPEYPTAVYLGCMLVKVCVPKNSMKWKEEIEHVDNIISL